MRFHSFGSGSSGNAFLLDVGETRILFDCGIGIRRLRAGLRELGAAGRLDAIVISHEHSDHIRSLKSLLRYEQCPVYASDGTLREIGRETDWVTLGAARPERIGSVEITPVPVAHDAREPFGFLVDAGTERIALFTDLGAPAPTVNDAIRESTIVVLEANYCERMLRHSRYPSFLKQRIRGGSGHLSNDQCAQILCDALTPEVHTLWLAHLSENNNTPPTAVGAVGSALGSRGIGLPTRALPRHDMADLLEPVAVERSWQTSLL